MQSMAEFHQSVQLASRLYDACTDIHCSYFGSAALGSLCLDLCSQNIAASTSCTYARLTQLLHVQIVAYAHNSDLSIRST